MLFMRVTHIQSKNITMLVESIWLNAPFINLVVPACHVHVFAHLRHSILDQMHKHMAAFLYNDEGEVLIWGMHWPEAGYTVLGKHQAGLGSTRVRGRRGVGGGEEGGLGGELGFTLAAYLAI